MDLGKVAIITAILLLVATGCDPLNNQTSTAPGGSPESSSTPPVSPTSANIPMPADAPVMTPVPTNRDSPSRLRVSEIQEGSVHLTWNAYPGATAYILEFAFGVDRSDWEWEEIARVEAPSLTFVH
jgi:hypothetical protein